MQITYTLEPADLTQYEKFCATRGRQRVTATRFLRIAIPIAILFAMIYYFESSSQPRPPAARSSALAMVISTVLPLIIVVCFWAYLKKAGKKSSAALFSRCQTLEISPDHLRHGSEGIESTVQWSRVYDIGSDVRSLYFFTDKETAYVVPKRAFHSPPLAEAFLETAISYWKDVPVAIEQKSGIWPPPPQVGT